MYVVYMGELDGPQEMCFYSVTKCMFVLQVRMLEKSEYVSWLLLILEASFNDLLCYLAAPESFKKQPARWNASEILPCGITHVRHAVRCGIWRRDNQLRDQEAEGMWTEWIRRRHRRRRRR